MPRWWGLISQLAGTRYPDTSHSVPCPTQFLCQGKRKPSDLTVRAGAPYLDSWERDGRGGVGADHKTHDSGAHVPKHVGQLREEDGAHEQGRPQHPPRAPRSQPHQKNLAASSPATLTVSSRNTSLLGRLRRVQRQIKEGNCSSPSCRRPRHVSILKGPQKRPRREILSNFFNHRFSLVIHGSLFIV